MTFEDEPPEYFLLDTNVISEGVAKKPDPRVMKWLDCWDVSQTFISVITIGEIRKGIALCASAEKRSTLESWLSREVRSAYHDRIMPIDFKVAECWGKIMARYKNCNSIDMMLAATAMVHNLTLVTRNVKHFPIDGLRVMNPWNE